MRVNVKKLKNGIPKDVKERENMEKNARSRLMKKKRKKEICKKNKEAQRRTT